MDKFIEFNVVKFLHESKTWKRKREQLYKELESITEIRGIDTSPIRSGKLNDSVAEVAAAREKIQRRIDQLEHYISVLNYACGRLTPDEKELIDLFFFRRGRIDKYVNDYGSRYALCRSAVYTKRRETLNKLSRIITSRFIGGEIHTK